MGFIGFVFACWRVWGVLRSRRGVHLLSWKERSGMPVLTILVAAGRDAWQISDFATRYWSIEIREMLR